MRLPRAACMAVMLLLAGCGEYAWNGTSYGPNTDVGSAPPPPVAAVPPGGQIYVVVPGDTVDSVAQQFGVPVQSLIDANHLAMPYALQGGQQLVIPGAAGSAGGIYTVQQGDTLTRISRQHATTVAELATLNGLQPPYPLRIGQQLRLPGSPAMATETAVASAPTLQMPPSQPAPSLPPAGNSTMTTETLAPPPGVSSAPQPTTGTGTPSTASTIALPAVGTGTSVTGAASSGTQTTSLPPPVLTPVNPVGAPSAPVLAPPPTPQASTQSTGSSATSSTGTGATSGTTSVLPPPTGNSSTVSPIGQATAALGSNQSAAEAPAPRSAGKFLWPVNGKVISPFGPKDGGQHNDGINIAAPLGTPVRAAENGVVVYAGNELRGFGNLLLIRHADGWVSAYAHCDSLLVKRGASVNRGQVIARVGQSGNVTSPQLHFELRKGAQAVDPMTELAPQGA